MGTHCLDAVRLRPRGARKLQNLALALVAWLALFVLAGCGGGGGTAASESITVQLPPSSQAVDDGESATLAVLADSPTPLTYQWQRDGEPIAGATEQSYVTPALSVSDSGVAYSVVVSAAGGETRVLSATVTVQPVAPSIGEPPQPQSVALGQQASFTVLAHGSQPLSYQWQRDGVDIPGAEAASYTAPAATTADAGARFRVVVRNAAGAVTSDDAVLNVGGSGPVVLGMLQTGVAAAGQSLVIETMLSGTPPFVYQWSRNGEPIDGAGGSSDSATLQLTTPDLTEADDGVRYAVTVTNAEGSTSSPAAVISVIGTSRVAAGGTHSLAVSGDGDTVWAWGGNARGQLGQGSTADSATPRIVEGLTGVKAVAAGAEHSLALKEDGTVWAWGGNAAGALGDGTQTDRAVPQRVGTLSQVVAVAAGDGRSFALRADGSLWAWGENTSGALGIGTQNHALAPAQVGQSTAGFAEILAVAAGARHSLALRSDGQVFMMGEVPVAPVGGPGVLPSPALVAGLNGIAGIAAGDGFSAALDINGGLWAWGSNGAGQLGLGDTTPRGQPTAVTRAQGGARLPALLRLAAGSDFALARSSSGTVYAWGAGASGQLGDGTSAGAAAPQAVTALALPMQAVAGGGAHVLAERADGAVYAWGANAEGQLGIGSGEARRAEPVQLQALDGD